MVFAISAKRVVEIVTQPMDRRPSDRGRKRFFPATAWQGFLAAVIKGNVKSTTIMESIEMALTVFSMPKNTTCISVVLTPKCGSSQQKLPGDQALLFAKSVPVLISGGRMKAPAVFLFPAPQRYKCWASRPFQESNSV